MSTAELENFRQLLIQRQSDLLQVKATGEGAASVVELDQTKVGRLSRMDAMQAQAMSVETNRRREIELQRIGTALQRLEGDEYGFCVSCGEDIARPRLEVDPSTPVCIDCAAAKK
jgi:RNA polymerase-binding transcription factor